MLLLRQCASFCKVAYTTRVTPTSSIAAALLAFDGEVRKCLEGACTGPLDPRAWLQAGLSTSAGGLGLRHAAAHGVAAYAASITATTDVCAALDANYIPPIEQAFGAMNAAVAAADTIPVPPPPNLRQRQLSQAVDRAIVAQLMQPAPGAESFRAHLQLLQSSGAGAWLHAPPSEALGLRIVSPLFKVLVRMRLRMALVVKDLPCPLCDGIADRFGDHARMCPCGGDRTKRHHRLRSVLAARAKAAGLSP